MSLNSSELRIWRVPSTQAWQHELQRWKYSFKSAGVPVALARWCFSGLTTMDHRETAHNVWPKKFRPQMSSAEDRWISLLCFIKVYTDSDYSSLALLLVHSWRQSRLTMFGKKKINRFFFHCKTHSIWHFPFEIFSSCSTGHCNPEDLKRRVHCFPRILHTCLLSVYHAKFLDWYSNSQH